MDKYICTLDNNDFEENSEIFEKINALNNLLLVDEVAENTELNNCIMEEFDLYKNLQECWWKKKKIEEQWSPEFEGYWWVDYNSKKIYFRYDEKK